MTGMGLVRLVGAHVPGAKNGVRDADYHFGGDIQSGRSPQASMKSRSS